MYFTDPYYIILSTVLSYLVLFLMFNVFYVHSSFAVMTLSSSLLFYPTFSLSLSVSSFTHEGMLSYYSLFFVTFE